MKFLIIDTTYDSSFAVVYNDGKIVYDVSSEAKGKTSERIVPFTEGVLKKAQVDKKELNAVFAVVGPGSFTGIRIGVSFVSALAFALGIEKAGIATFYGLGSKDDYKIIPSRKDYYYYSFGDETGEVYKDDLPEIKKIKSRYSGINDVSDIDFAANLVERALDIINKNEFDEVLRPLYLKKSQAERMKEKK
ncbi:MAG: tRNA (adenosine(37)-N6)-threonylcarbamoyltransferase complex dimerization subunit type 1 TsaB [Clostridia bacterium]|nr:tRNA (adenosine(37)-N6)-threonylcarbamoyltransferase complex dimerization subunit type 1 TsaB [Clostridia bacterium]